MAVEKNCTFSSVSLSAFDNKFHSLYFIQYISQCTMPRRPRAGIDPPCYKGVSDQHHALATLSPEKNRHPFYRWLDGYARHHHHHPVVCLTTGSKSLPKQSLHILRSRASSSKWEHPFLSLRSSSSFLRLLPCLLVTSISPFIFPSITCFRRQFLRKMWPIQLAFRFLIACRIFLCSLTWSNTSSFLTWSVQLIFSVLLQHHISKLSKCFLSKT